MRFLLACLLLFSASLVLEACRLQPNQIVGDVNAVDIAAKLNGASFLTTTTFDVNGPGFTAQFDVSSENTDFGCVFSAGTPGSNTYIEARLITLATSPNMHALSLTFGTQKTQTFGVIPKKTWAKVAITVSNQKVGGLNGFYDVQVYVNGQNVPLNARLTTSGVPTGTRTMMIGKCYSDNSGFTGMIDNLRLISRVKSLQEIQDSNVQFFPMPESEGLIVYYDFNDMSDVSVKTVGRIGSSSPAEIPAALHNGVVAMVRKGTAGDKVSNVCVKQGLAVPVADGLAQPPFFGKGGYAQTILCDAKSNTSFIVNQRFTAAGAIDSISIRTGQLHYWRITAGGLKVEHRTWGGWSMLPRGADFLVNDKTTFRFTDDAVTIQAGPYGFIKITEDDKKNLNYQIGVDSNVCVQPTDYVGYCDFHQTQLSTFEFSSFPVPEMPMGVLAKAKGVLGQAPILACPPPSTVYRPDLLPPPAPVPLDPIPARPGPDPCISYPAARLALFSTACNLNFGDGSSRQRCMADSCIANNPYEPPKITCEAQKLIKLTDPLFQVDPSCDTVCPKGCNNRGQCVNGSCVCPAGWVGNDCGSPASFPCWNATSTAGSTVLRPLFVRSSGSIVPSATFLASLPAFTASYRVVDSTIVFIARTVTSSSDATPAYHIVFVNNNGNGNANGGQMTATITGAGVSSARIASAVVGGPAVTSSLSGNTYTISSSWRFSGYSVIAVSGLPNMADVTVTITSTGGLDQVLVGSAHLKESDSNLASYKVPLGSAIRISGGTCNDACAAVTSCSSCAALAACGWCVDSGKCVPGDRSGPWTYGICQNWRYTFDAKQSRRLTQQLAFPVNPGYTDVIVTTADSLDLPVEIIVAPRDPTKATWDVVYAAQYNRNIRPMFTTYIESILNTLTGYPNLGVGFISVKPGSFDLIRDLSNPRDTFYIPQAVRGQPQSAVGAISVLATLNNLPIAWRDGSSRLVLFVADQPYIPNEVAPDTVRATLARNGVIPVFLVSDDVAASYQSLVTNDLQYGIVMTGIPFNSAQNSIPQATVRAIQRAAGYASTYYTSAGIINTASWNSHKSSWQLYGLQPSIFARFLIPTKGLADASATATTVLQMPGYGSAKVENILSDRPVAFATVTKYEVKEGKMVLVTLNGRSLRDLFKTLPKIVTLPTKGNLNLVQDVLANGKPTGELVAGDVISVVGATSNDLLNRIFYTANAGTGGQTDFFELSVTDTCSDSDKVRIDINIAKDNRPPVTEMLPVTLNEDTASVITLEAADPNSDLLNLFVTQIIHELDQEGKPVMGRAGKLYQYSSTLLGTRPADNDANAQSFLINAGDQVSDSKGRVIYWPPQNANSYADDKKTPFLKIHPCFEYKAKEASTTEKFESSPTRVTIDVFSVNDAPFVWEDEDPSYPASSAGYGWSTPAGVCWKDGPDCTWDEDFGQEFPWNTPYKYIYVGGDDIEKSELDIIIKSIQCDPLANLTLDLFGNVPLKVGDVIQQRKPGVLAPGIRFRPGPDRNNQNGGFGDYYCKISYVTRDDDNAESTNNRVVTISINPVDDKPRIRQQTTLITAVEKIPKEFLIDAFDPEGDSFDVVVVGCNTRQRGRFEICMDKECTLANRQTFTCDDVKDSNGGIKLNKRTSKRALVPTKQGYLGIFTSFSLGRPTDGLNYQRLTVSFPSPKDNGATPATFDIFFNVIALNNAPVISVNNNTNEQVALTLVNGEKFLPVLEISDEDISNGNINVKITVSPANEGTITFVDRSTNQEIKSSDIKSVTADSVSLSGKLLSINAILSGFVFTPKKSDSVYTFTITANDNGNSGQCPMGKDGKPIPFERLLYDSSSTCAMTSTAKVAVSYVDPTQLKTIALASSGAAVLVLGLIGAALAVRAFNKQAESASYKPWDVFHESDAVLSNPLYEEAALGGASGIYEGKSNKDLLGSSSESPQYIGMDKSEAGGL